MSIHFRNKVLIFLCCLILSSCIKEVNLDYPNYQEQLVLVGILQPDSTIKIRLQKTLPILDTSKLYPIINEAEVLCYENDKLVGKMLPETDGFYRLRYFPKSGFIYRIEAYYQDYHLVAEDTIPFPKELNVMMLGVNNSNPNKNPDIELYIKRPQISYIWLSAILDYYDLFEKKRRIRSAGITSSYPLFDAFNAYKSIEGKNSYDTYVRLKPEFTGEVRTIFSVVNQVSNVKSSGDMFYFQVSDVSYNYDRYIKSSLLAYGSRPLDASGELGNPFSEPVAIYSNVKGGVGILGAMHTRQIILKHIK